MANSFNKKDPRFIDKKPDKRNLIALLIFLILFLLLGTTVPLDKVPGVSWVLEAMGYDSIQNRGITLANIISRSVNINSGYRVDRNSDLYYAMSAVSPEGGQLGESRLLDAARLRREGLRAPGISGVVRNKDGIFSSSDYLIDPSKFNSLQEGAGGDVPLAAEDAEGPSPESGFLRPSGGQNIGGPGKSGVNVNDISKTLGVANKGSLTRRLDKKGNYVVKKDNSVDRGSLNALGEDAYSQAGTAWLFTRAGDRAKIPDVKKSLAQAAFDGSMLPDDVILRTGETFASLAEGSSPPSANDLKKFNQRRETSKECQKARLSNAGAADTQRKAIQAAVDKMRTAIPECGPRVPPYNCRGDGVWNKQLDKAMTACGKYNDIQQAIASACGMAIQDNTGRCDKAAVAAQLKRCSFWDQSGSAFTGCWKRVSVDSVAASFNKEGLAQVVLAAKF